jgi:NAD(P)-dependent dehydrogenase (short-subunit alcohol dehydrogenase family)
VYAAARNISALDPLVARHGSQVTALQLDVTNAAQIGAAAATAGDVDLLINNAGIVGFFGGDFTDPKWIEGGRQEMEVNFLGTFAVTQAFAPVLAKNGGGAIVNLNSVASFVSFPILAAYSASKAATHSLTQVTRAMLRGQNTHVFGVYPGPIDTRMAEPLPLEKTGHHLGRRGNLPRQDEPGHRGGLLRGSEGTRAAGRGGTGRRLNLVTGH